ncbi:hypothetical protein [Rivularia sp. UHCC 0363]|uniref:hypothetical protein n=1 Tax=Rivularia sp. UHCC 0363 TaxID=3110244 RepID=UPI002B220B8B|nr:hypothetical protein [Rivularia sp. UHCC 0363]MEA5595675.1 hypothetical protein [Rivularia sp. UHCC 0363]
MENFSYLAATNHKYLTSAARTILRKEIIEWGDTHLDYGCGKGGDVEKMRSLGFNSWGYDPHYFPCEPKAADVVTQNYVVNVIETVEGRLEAIQKSWELSKKKLLIVANTSSSKNVAIDKGRYSGRGVFYKTFRSSELRAYIEVATGKEVVRIDKDKFLVTRDNNNVKLWDYQEVLELINLYKNEYIAPPTTYIRGDCMSFHRIPGFTEKDLSYAGTRRAYRMSCRDRILPGRSGKLVKQMWLGKYGSELFEWGCQAIRLRNEILKAKFRCKQLKFLEDFSHLRRFDFLYNPDFGIILDDGDGQKPIYKANIEALRQGNTNF